MSLIVLPIIVFVVWIVLARGASPNACWIAAACTFFLAGFLMSAALAYLFLALLVCAITSQIKFLSPYQTKISAAAIAVSMLVVVGMMSVRCFRLEKLAASYPVVSLRERAESSQQPIVAEFPEREPPHENYWKNRRLAAINILHRSAVAHFLDAPDFGVTRMSFDPLVLLKNDDESPVQLNAYEGYASDEKFKSNSTYSPNPQSLESHHDELQSWFISTSRNGVVEDVDHVAGFLPHGITDHGSKNPLTSGNLWNDPSEVFSGSSQTPFTLQCLQLVGLLYHDTPVVYDLDTAPTLVDAKTAPIRPLDEFENRALEALKQGNPLYYEVRGERLRMMGALINAESCTQCHTGPTNQLLGAFSYILTTDKSPAEIEDLAQVRAAREVVKNP